MNVTRVDDNETGEMKSLVDLSTEGNNGEKMKFSKTTHFPITLRFGINILYFYTTNCKLKRTAVGSGR